MGSHSRNITRALRELDEIKKILKANAHDPYTKGLYNGMELARFLMSSTKTNYYQKLDFAYQEINKSKRELNDNTRNE
jgi:hypothetical protein